MQAMFSSRLFLRTCANKFVSRQFLVSTEFAGDLCFQTCSFKCLLDKIAAIHVAAILALLFGVCLLHNVQAFCLGEQLLDLLLQFLQVLFGLLRRELLVIAQIGQGAARSHVLLGITAAVKVVLRQCIGFDWP